MLLLFPSSLIFAQEEDKSENKRDIGIKIKRVDHIANIRERIQERINLFFKFSPQDKAYYQKELAEKRLAELSFVIENKKGDFIEETSSRYSTYLGRLTETVTDKKLSNMKGELLKMLENHKLILDELIKPFESNSGFWLLLQHNINVLQIYADQIKNL